MNKLNKLTTANGSPVGDNQNVQAAGARGPMICFNQTGHFNNGI